MCREGFVFQASKPSPQSSKTLNCKVSFVSASSAKLQATLHACSVLIIVKAGHVRGDGDGWFTMNMRAAGPAESS